MLEDGESLQQCEFCFSLMAYLMGHCPVCNDTGLVKKPAREPLVFEDNDYAKHNRECTDPREAAR